MWFGRGHPLGVVPAPISDIGPLGPVRGCCELPGGGLLPPPLLVLAGGLLATPMPVLAEVLAAGEDDPRAELAGGGG